MGGFRMGRNKEGVGIFGKKWWIWKILEKYRPRRSRVAGPNYQLFPIGPGDL